MGELISGFAKTPIFRVQCRFKIFCDHGFNATNENVIAEILLLPILFFTPLQLSVTVLFVTLSSFFVFYLSSLITDYNHHIELT